MTVGAIMGYHPAAGVNADEFGPILDNRFGRLFGGSRTATAGVRYYDAYPDGIERRVRTIADIGISGSYGPHAMTYNYELFCTINGPSNGAAIFCLRSTDLSLIRTFGTADSSFANNANHIENGRRMCAIQNPVGRVDYLIVNSSSTDGVLNCVDLCTMQNQTIGPVDENYTELGSVPDGSGEVAYVIGYTKLGNDTQIGFYRAIVNGLVSVRKILVAEIDATWTYIQGVRGVSVDQTDGHPIIGVQTTDTVTSRAYLVKIHKTTGVVQWKIAVAGSPGNINYDAGMKWNVIKNSRLYYLGSASNALWTVNTLAGTATSATLSNAALNVLNGDQCSEDTTGSVMWVGDWSEGSSHPAYLGNYMLTLGNHSGTAMFFRYFPAGTPSPAPVYGIPAASRKRAWSFTLDGHVFYVLDLGKEGTFLYDDTTGEWSQWITKNFNQWNLTNGTMWGQRIVGGDILTTDIWEVQPGALFDNGSTEITHIVSGELIKRNRVFVSCDAFRLAVSAGQLDDVNGATVLLEFSDDQAQTWVTMDTLSLTEGDYSGEVAWRSLGSFAAPGRIFRITDVGGFLRIDGADAGIQDFDEDGQQAAQPKGG